MLAHAQRLQQLLGGKWQAQNCRQPGGNSQQLLTLQTPPAGNNADMLSKVEGAFTVFWPAGPVVQIRLAYVESSVPQNLQQFTSDRRTPRKRNAAPEV